ncbi:caspase-3 [Papilio machaon]|uniref:caspase-3 n=1 Tax=Papilio machaon TaxID=76193 RepID=UPI001E6629B3|nr:caspase-3 [Papilio machaon]
MEETFADVSPSYPTSSSQNASKTSGAGNETRPVNKAQPVFNPEDLFYDMSGDKYLVIFNHTKYKMTRYFHFQTPTPRKGTEKDVESLKKTFSNLGYKVLTYHDLDHGEILNKALEISRMDHTMTSCLCFAILTHGDKGGQLFASDRPYQFSDVTKMLENGDKSLVNKPKLFFIQACRGGDMDDGRTVQLDSDDDLTFHVPSHADFFTMYSSVEGYAAFRTALGSFLIQELCQAIDKYHDTLDVLHIATTVNRRVAYEYSTYTPSNKNTHNKKQMPEVRYTLTKLFKF